jgi:hypothetical protein
MVGVGFDLEGRFVMEPSLNSRMRLCEACTKEVGRQAAACGLECSVEAIS